jgi:hypothetical protein
MGKMGSAIEVLRGLLEGREGTRDDGLGYVHPSTLAQGCLLAVARELLGMPKEEPSPHRRRIMQAGTAAHERILGYFRPVLLAREVPFLDPALRIKGRCDALLFIPERLSQEPGFHVLEVKTTSSLGFAEVKGEGTPKPEHRRQCLIYQHCLEGQYGIPLRGGIVYYENRDSLEYALFPVPKGEEEIAPFLRRLPAVISLAREGRLPEAPEYRLPQNHWAHRYCPYLHSCPYGQESVKAARGRGPPDQVMAKIIAERIVQKKKKPRRERSLEELARELGWE